jgi:AP2-associated kinase
MRRFNPFSGKVQNGLEANTFDVGNVKITVRNVIAKGGFSSVYLARDAVHVSTKQYALRHIVCNDSESLDLVMKEIKVTSLLKGHLKVVTLVAHDVFDMSRTKEALLFMEFCDNSLVSIMESRGNGYYKDKKALLIFRDVCDAVFSMHGQSPPITHRYVEICICEKQRMLYSKNIKECPMMHVLSSVKWLLSAVLTVLSPGIIEHMVSLHD